MQLKVMVVVEEGIDFLSFKDFLVCFCYCFIKSMACLNLEAPLLFPTRSLKLRELSFFYYFFSSFAIFSLFGSIVSRSLF